MDQNFPTTVAVDADHFNDSEELIQNSGLQEETLIEIGTIYYNPFQPEVTDRHSSDEALCLSIRTRHDGHWDESEQKTEEALRTLGR